MPYTFKHYPSVSNLPVKNLRPFVRGPGGLEQDISLLAKCIVDFSIGQYPTLG